DLLHLAHQLLERGKIERLHAVAECAVRIGMDLDDQPVGPAGDRRARHRQHGAADADAVRRVDYHRQVRLALEDGNGVQIEGVARHGLEGADSPLAEDHLLLPRETMYSAAMSSSLIVDDIPRLSR